jgi:hypothetical protein
MLNSLNALIPDGVSSVFSSVGSVFRPVTNAVSHTLGPVISFVQSYSPDMTSVSNKANEIFQENVNYGCVGFVVLSEKIHELTGWDTTALKTALPCGAAILMGTAAVSTGGFAGLALRVSLIYVTSKFDKFNQHDATHDSHSNMKANVEDWTYRSILCGSVYSIFSSIRGLNPTELALSIATLAYFFLKDGFPVSEEPKEAEQPQI